MNPVIMSGYLTLAYHYDIEPVVPRISRSIEVRVKDRAKHLSQLYLSRYTGKLALL